MTDIVKAIREAAHPKCSEAFKSNDESCCIGCWRTLTVVDELEKLRHYVDVYDTELSEETALADALYSLIVRMDPDNGYTVDDDEYEMILQVYEARRGE